MTQIQLRAIQHYLYCPHRWGLMEIDMAWAENYYVVKANLMHERVHDPKRSYISRGKKILTSIRVFNDHPAYGIYGVTDCIELSPAADGIILGDGERYHLNIVEYKPTMPKGKLFREEDAMQVFAQKICVDSVFGCDCTGSIYYSDEKKRIKVPLNENFSELDSKLRLILQEMRYYILRGEIPKRVKGQYCGGCSMKDICMPIRKKSKRMHTNTQEMIAKEL